MNWFLVLLVLQTIFLIARDNLRKIYLPSSTKSDLILRNSPSDISAVNIVFTFLKILSKYIPTPLTKAVPLIPHSDGKSFDLPLLRLRGPISLSKDKVEKAFRQAVALGSGPPPDESAPLNLLFLPCLAGPILPLLLSQRSCPVLPLGAVNTSNTFTILRPDIVRDITRLRSSNLTFSATFGGPLQPGIRRKRGMEFSIEIEIMAENSDYDLDGPEVLVRQSCWFLMFLSRDVKPVWDSKSTSSTEATSKGIESLTLVNARPRLPLSLTAAHPRKWAACCKDYNPIHVSWLGAKLFGFPSVIVHGNHVAALVLEMVAQDTKRIATEMVIEKAKASAEPNDAFDAVRQMIWADKRAVVIEVKFLRPLVLPAKVEVGWFNGVQNSHDGIGFIVGKGEKVYTTGVYTYNST